MRGMNGEERRELILEHLRGHEAAQVDQLARRLGVSRMTIHRDLDRLAELNMVRKVRGGATVLPSTVFESDFSYRLRMAVDEKQAVARAAADLVSPGMAILIDDSTTVNAVVPLLQHKLPLTVITNALGAIDVLKDVKGLTLIALGGQYDPIGNAFFGITCERAVTSLRVDLAIMSAAGIRDLSAFLHHENIVRAKTAMLSIADRRVLIVDHTKFRRTSLNLFASLLDFDRVITTDRLEPPIQAALREKKVPLEIVRM